LRTGSDPTDPFNTPNVLVDQLDLLLIALGPSYHLVNVSTLTDLAFPVSQDMTVRFTDRDAIIARADVPVGNFQGHLYSTLLSFPPGQPLFTAPRGWISADVTVGTNTFRFVATHLESSGGLYGNPLVDLIQAAQAGELAATFAGSTLPVVIAADFNSNATHTPPEQTASYGIMLDAGFTDSWRAIHRGEPGFTWPMYVEDPLQDHPQGPFERIDFVFVDGLAVTSAERTGVKAPHSSDHAGVVATLAF
jgi:endonuclease/exonuclease/phosphatase family metal-dependent hydrolase